MNSYLSPALREVIGLFLKLGFTAFGGPAAHVSLMHDEVVTRRTATTPVLLLDDVFSELDPDRSDALLHSLPAGQTILSTAGALPTGAVPGRVLHVREGVVTSG